MVLVHISRITENGSGIVRGGVRYIAVRELVAFKFIYIVPYSGILEAPEGVERICSRTS